MIVNVFFTIVPPADVNITKDCQPHYMEEYLLPAWVTNDTWYRNMPRHTVGRAVPYAPNLMNSTAEFRGMNLEGFKGGVATNSVGMMGQVVWLKRPGNVWEGPFLVVDVGQRNHAYHQAMNVKTIVEVDFETAIEWGIYSYSRGSKGYVINRWFEGDVEMWVGLEKPTAEEDANSIPVNYEKWYGENAEFCDGESNRKWRVEDWMIMNYGEYKAELNKPNSPHKAVSMNARLKRLAVLQEINEPDIGFNPIALAYYMTTYTTEIDVVEAVVEEPVIEEAADKEPVIMKTHTLGKNETWTHLALRYYGNTTEAYWRLIYEANIDLVGDDYRRIWGGMEIEIPVLPPDFSP
jgi:hypothetical protein